MVARDAGSDGGERGVEVMVCTGRRWRPGRIDFAGVGGEPALVFHRKGGVCSVDTVRITDGRRIAAYRRVMNPGKPERVRAVTPERAVSSP